MEYEDKTTRLAAERAGECFPTNSCPYKQTMSAMPTVTDILNPWENKSGVKFMHELVKHDLKGAHIHPKKQGFNIDP